MSLNIPLKGLLSIIVRNHFIFMNRELKHLNLTEGQVPYLVALSKNEQLTQDDLANMFYIDKGTIARTIQKLEGKELVQRLHDPVNRRRYRLSLTEKGEEIVPEILHAEKKWENILFKDFSDEESSLLVENVATLAKNSLKLNKNWE